MKREVMVITRSDLGEVPAEDVHLLLQRIHDRCRFLTESSLKPGTLEVVTKVRVASKTKRREGVFKRAIVANVQRRDWLHSLFPVQYSALRALRDRHVPFKRMRLEGWTSTGKSLVLEFRAE